MPFTESCYENAVLQLFTQSLGYSYATGTSSGTVAVLVPVLVPVVVPMGVAAPFLLGAIVSGAVFGDQSSPISDSVIFSSSMTGVPIMDHIRTQVPYTVSAWAAAFAGYLLLGFVKG